MRRPGRLTSSPTQTIPRTTCPRGADPGAPALPPASAPQPPRTRSWALPSRDWRQSREGLVRQPAQAELAAARARALVPEPEPEPELALVPAMVPAELLERDRRTGWPTQASDSLCQGATAPAAEPTPAR